MAKDQKHMFKFLKSKTRRVNDDLDEMFTVVTVSISMMESEFDPDFKKGVAEICRKLLVGCKRGAEGVAQLRRVSERCSRAKEKAEGNDTDLYEWTCEAAILASTIIFADHQIRTLDGMARGHASFKLAAIQGRIEGFLERQGVPGWGVPYFRVPEFEALADEEAGR